MPNYYTIVTKFPGTTTDYLCAALNLGSGGPQTIAYTVYRFGAPPVQGSVTTNSNGFARATLPAGATDALVKVAMLSTGGVAVQQVQSGGTGLLYVAYPDENQAFGTGFEIARSSGTAFMMIANKFTSLATLTIFTRGGSTTQLQVQPLSVTRVSFSTPDTYIRISSDLAVLIQVGLGDGYVSSLAPHA